VPPALAAPRRSPLLARCLLLSACVLGLAGLAAPGHHHAAAAQLTATAASTTAIEIEPRAPHTLASPAPLIAQRASRSRTVATPKKRTAAHLQADRWVRPSSAGIVSPYGMRWGRLHKGVDFGAHYGAPIHAIGDGVVVGTGYQSGESGYGQITIIRHSDGYYSAYAHQSSYLVHPGDHVTAGEVIGYVGATGQVTGPHLHFEIRTVEHGGQVNPVPWLRSHGVDV
jgi:murein DD-endopeptidase MepM/ murein hydrolase activator NlpD